MACGTPLSVEHAQSLDSYGTGIGIKWHILKMKKISPRVCLVEYWIHLNETNSDVHFVALNS